MNNKTLETYRDYTNKIGNRIPLYQAVTKEFNIKTALYPGSHIDIAPSMLIPKVTYVDHFKGAISFFKDRGTIKEYIEQNKQYKAPCEIDFFGQDYAQALAIDQVDLIISQYAGFVGQQTKGHLKIGGILLCNDSHGDATLAKFDEDFELTGIADDQNNIQHINLEQYFNLPKSKTINLDTVKEKMKSPKYTLVAENYLYRKIK